MLSTTPSMRKAANVDSVSGASSISTRSVNSSSSASPGRPALASASATVSDSAAQVRFHLQALLLLFGERLAEILPAVARAALAVVHRHVGVLDQRLRAIAVFRRARDADAGGDAEFLAGHAEAFAEGAEDRDGEALRAFEVVAGGAHDQEFVAAEARDQAFGGDRVLDAARGAGDHLVARGVAEHVVDDLEAIQVDVQHGDAGLRGIGQAAFEFFEHRVAV